LGGNGSGGNNFDATIVIVSLRSLVSIMQREEKHNEKQRKINIDKKKKYIVVGFQETKKKGSSSISV
jgi:hypothetical protein